MAPKKSCFMDANRPCDLTCKAAFEVDDPVDNVDCYFIWLSHHFGEALFSLRNLTEGMGGFAPPGGGSGFPGFPGGSGGTGGPGASGSGPGSPGGPGGPGSPPSPPKGGYPQN